MDATEGDWAIVVEYEKEPIGSDSDDCKRKLQAEIKALKKKKYRKIEIRRFQTLIYPPKLRNRATVSEFQIQA